MVASSFAATLAPDGEYCYLSTILCNCQFNNQSCSEIAEKLKESEDLQLSSYSDGDYIILTPI